MRLRLSWVLLGLLVPTLAYADDHWADNYAGFSGGNGGSTLKGVHDSLAIGFPKMWVDLTVVPVDFSVQFGEQVTQVIYMAGARYTWAPPGRMHANKVLLQALFGTVYTNDGASTSTDKTDKDFALGLGAGYEFAKVIKGQSLTFRGIYDRIKRNGDRDEWFNRVSAGIGYRWGTR